MTFLRKNFFVLFLALFLVIVAAASYYRFEVLHDYYVTYEIGCDAEISSCYVGCEDEECDETYHYAEMERHAQEIFTTCGPNILECEVAEVCPDTDVHCAISYCDPDNSWDECALPEDINNDI